MKDLLDEVKLADEVGLDVYAVGEHHRPEYLSSSPATFLAAAAAVTNRIRLSSAVTVLSSDDPVRVFQQFATVDLISAGRTEIMVGRGSFIESFPLFGNDLRDYDGLFAEKLDLLLKLRAEERVTWSGSRRPGLEDAGIYPRPVQQPLPVWLAVGGTPASVVRAGTLGLPLALAIIGGNPARFAGMAGLYRQTLNESGHDPSTPLSLNLHGFLADSAERAADIAWEPFSMTMNRIGRERGWPPVSRSQFEAEIGPSGALLLGSPEEVAAKIARHHALFRHDRTLIQLSVGSVPREAMMRAIELLGTVKPIVQEMIDGQSESGPPAR